VGTTNLPLETFLDLEGDADGTYDLGDFRLWVLGNPNHPVNTPPGAGAARALVPADPIVIPLSEGTKSEGTKSEGAER
jgi:hypothetical protein